MKNLLLILSTCVLLGACDNATKEQESNKKVTLTVSAAASLKNALSDIEKEYEEKHQNVDIKFNYGASGALSQQIISGAPVDIFFSAAQDKVDYLVNEKAVDRRDTKTVLKNHLVLISNKQLNSIENLKDDDVKKIALGNPELVPAGEYGKEVLDKLKLYNTLQPKLVLTKDVRQVLTYVETGNTEAGIVYHSDLKTSNKIQHQIEINEDLHKPITYPIAKIKDRKNKKAVSDLFTYLQNDEALKIYEKYGFDVQK